MGKVIHPVRFNRKQVKFIQDIIREFLEYDVEEALDLDVTLTKSETESELHPVRFDKAQIKSLKCLIGDFIKEDYDLGEDQIPSILSAINSAEGNEEEDD